MPTTDSDLVDLIGRALPLLEGCDGTNVTQLKEAVELCERIAARAPKELATLQALPPSEGLSLWILLTGRATGTMGRLMETHLAKRVDSAMLLTIEQLGRKLHAANSVFLAQPVKRLVQKREQEVRS